MGVISKIKKKILGESVVRSTPIKKTEKVLYIKNISLKNEIIEAKRKAKIDKETANNLIKELEKIYSTKEIKEGEIKEKVTSKQRKEKIKETEEIKLNFQQAITAYKQELFKNFKNYNIKTDRPELDMFTEERYAKVTELTLENNENLDELPESIMKNFKNLQYLRIVNAPKLTELFTGIKDTQIKKIDLIDTGISNFQEEIKPFLKGIHEQKQLTIRKTKTAEKDKEVEYLREEIKKEMKLQ